MLKALSVILFATLPFVQAQETELERYNQRLRIQELKGQRHHKNHFEGADAMFESSGRALFDIGATTINSTETDIFGVYGTNVVDIVIGRASISGDADFTILQQGCYPISGGLRECAAQVGFKPKSIGAKSARLVMNYQMSDGQTSSRTWDIKGTGLKPIPPPEKQICEDGSIIDVDSKSLREFVPAVGTEISLVYSSLFTKEYKASHSEFVARNPSFNPEGWTVSLQHFYDASSSTLLLGSGTLLKRGSIPDGSGNALVVNADDVYVFAPSGRHIQTKSYLMGFTKFRFEYNAQGKISKITDAFGKATSFNRNASGALSSITSPFAQNTVVAVNAQGLLAQVRDPLSNTYNFTYISGTDQLEIFQKPNANGSKFGYRGSGWLEWDYSLGGSSVDYTYSHNGDAPTIQSVSAMGKTTFYQADRDETTGRYVRTVASASGLRTNYVENPDRTSSTSNIYKTTTTSTRNDERFGGIYRRDYQYSETIKGSTKTTRLDRSTTLTNPADPYSYSRITDTIDINGIKWTQTFVKGTRTQTSVTPMNVKSVTLLDAFERPVRTQLGADTPISLSYDALGRLSKTWQGEANALTYAYDAKGNLASVTNALNQKTKYGYDGAGRKTSITLPDNRVSTIQYDKNSQVIGITPPGRSRHTFTYDVSDLLKTYEPPILAVEATVNTVRTYDKDKKVTKIQRPDGRAVVFSYQNQSLLKRMDLAPGSSQIYTYYPSSEQAQFIDSPDAVRSEFSYFGPSQIQSEKITEGSSSSKVSFSYDNFFRKKSRSLEFDGIAAGTYTITYRTDNQPTKIGAMTLDYEPISGRLSATTLGGVKDIRTYDAFGNLKSYSATFTPAGGTAKLIYEFVLTRDTLHRVIKKVETVQGGTTTYDYGFDVVGRLSTVKKNGVLESQYNYDSNSNKISGSMNKVSFTSTYDAQDRMLTFQENRYAHNANGELTEVVNGLGARSVFTTDSLGRIKQVKPMAGGTVDYKLDWDGRRTQVLLNSAVQARYLYEDAYRLAAEKVPSSGQIKEYVYGTGINSPDYMKVGGATYRILKDHLGSPRMVVKSTDGTIAQKLNYNEWGKITEDTKPGFQPFGFAGGMYDRYSKLVKFGARDYDPETGRWTSKDPILFQGGDTNLYGYVMNDPVNFFDPNGLSPVSDVEIDNWERFGDIVNDFMYTIPCENSANRTKEKENWEAKNPIIKTPVIPLLPPPFNPVPPVTPGMCKGGKCG